MKRSGLAQRLASTGPQFPGPAADEVGLELRDHCQEVDQQPADRVAGVVD
jgi:hypothetical protein